MNEYFLSYGGHRTREDGVCAMEWVAYLAGEEHSARPECVSDALRAFCIGVNDALADGQRQRLRPYLARTIGTRGDGLDAQRRWLCTDWVAREYVPGLLDLVPELWSDAAALRALPPVASLDDVRRAEWLLCSVAVKAARATVGMASNSVAIAWATGAAGQAVLRVANSHVVRVAAVTIGSHAVRLAIASGPASALTHAINELQDSILRPGGLLDRMLPTEIVQLPVGGEHEIRGLSGAETDAVATAQLTT